MQVLLCIRLCLSLSLPAHAADIAASPPQNLSVTVYRNPERTGGSIDLANLGGFALVTETRLVHLPVGETRLRFEGVVDGIMAESAIITGLPGGVIEKNRDAALLDPSALILAARNEAVLLKRTNAKTGTVSRVAATIESASSDGIIFKTADGVEALHCSGLPETFSFARVPNGLSALPTLSVLTRSAHEISATVQLSYLTTGFDWAADYVATVAADGKTLDLGAWVTLANGNSVSLPEAATHVVAGKLNREAEPETANISEEQVVAQCWPRGSTSDPVEVALRQSTDARRRSAAMQPMMKKSMAADAAGNIVVTASRVSQEQLGDLKLYRVPEPTTVAAQQSKQVRLMDQAHVPFQPVYTASVAATETIQGSRSAHLVLRTKNDLAHHLGLPLPSGRVSIFQHSQQRPMLLGETQMKDHAIDEEVECDVSESADVHYSLKARTYNADAQSPKLTPLTPRLRLAQQKGRTMMEADISNARSSPVAFELRLSMLNGQAVINTDHPIGKKDGRTIFRLNIPANGKTVVHYTVVQ